MVTLNFHPAHGLWVLPLKMWGIEFMDQNGWVFGKLYHRFVSESLRKRENTGLVQKGWVTWSRVPFRVLILVFIRLCCLEAWRRRNWSVQLAHSQGDQVPLSFHHTLRYSFQEGRLFRGREMMRSQNSLLILLAPGDAGPKHVRHLTWHLWPSARTELITGTRTSWPLVREQLSGPSTL